MSICFSVDNSNRRVTTMLMVLLTVGGKCVERAEGKFNFSPYKSLFS